MTIFSKPNSPKLHFKITIKGTTYQGSTFTSDMGEAKLFVANKRASILEKIKASVALTRYVPTTTPLSYVVSEVKKALMQKNYNTREHCHVLDEYERVLGPNFLVEQFGDDAIRCMIAREHIMGCLQGRAKYNEPFDVIATLVKFGLHPHPENPDLTTTELIFAKFEAEKYAKSHLENRKPRAPGTIAQKIIEPAFLIVSKAQSLRIILDNPPVRSTYKHFKGTRANGFVGFEFERRLFDNCPAERAAIYDFTMWQMLRVSEVYNLKWQDVDLANGTITIKTKGGRQHFRLFGPAVDILRTQIGRHETYVFVREIRGGR